MVSSSAPRFLRLGAVLLISAALVDCKSAPKPAPPPPKPAPAPPPPPPPPPPPALHLPLIRSVDTPRVQRVQVEELSRKLADRVRQSGTFSIANIATSTKTEGAPPCFTEACAISAAQQAGIKSVLYSRLVQYAEACVLLGVLYDVESQKNDWAFSHSFPCEAAGVDNAVNELGAAFLARGQPTTRGPAYAVTPIQHDIADIAYASESWAEYLGTLLATGGKTVVPAANVAQPLAGKKEPYKNCPEKKCALELSLTAGAQRAITAKITRKKPLCTVTAAVYDLGTKTSSISASAKGGCAAADIADAMRSIATTLIGEPSAAAAAPAPPAAQPAQPAAKPQPATDDLK